MSRRSLTAGAVVLLLLIGCSSGDDPIEATAAAEAPTIESAAAELPDEQFCVDGNSFVTDTRTRLVATPDAATFVAIDAQLAGLAERSPVELIDSVSALRAGFDAVGQAYAATGYDPTATLTLDPELQDESALAGSTLRSYLLTNCDLAATRDAQVAQIVEAFGVEDVATAECVHAQLGDIANIESSSLTPELMTAPVCGTSILGLLSGDSASDS